MKYTLVDYQLSILEQYVTQIINLVLQDDSLTIKDILNMFQDHLDTKKKKNKVKNFVFINFTCV